MYNRNAEILLRSSHKQLSAVISTSEWSATMASKQSPHNETAQATIKNILIVEDDGNIAELLVQTIAHETSYQVFAAPDAPQALELTKEIQPHLLVLDYGLPTMNGIELFDQLHIIEGLEQVPTIMLSANIPFQEIRKRQMMYMRKPFDINKLLETINQLLA